MKVLKGLGLRGAIGKLVGGSGLLRAFRSVKLSFVISIMYIQQKDRLNLSFCRWEAACIGHTPKALSASRSYSL